MPDALVEIENHITARKHIVDTASHFWPCIKDHKALVVIAQPQFASFLQRLRLAGGNGDHLCQPLPPRDERLRPMADRCARWALGMSGTLRAGRTDAFPFKS